MTEAHIQFAPDILRRLGEELNPSIDQGILELIKNAYDANARTCTVTLTETAKTGGKIEVQDDGDGMSLEDIITGWLVLGRSSKSVGNRTRIGRVPAGSKGLGRLAALRLGRIASLVTRPRNETNEFRLTIDWDRYDNAQLVEDVLLPIEDRARSATKSGTTITISDIRDALGRMEVKRLARAMILLSDPVADESVGFQPVLRASEFADLEQLVKDRYFKDADYHLVADLHNGIASARVVDWRGETLFEGSHRDIAESRNDRPYQAPTAHFDLWAFVLTQARFSTRAITLQEVRTWIEAFGGVHLYLNGLRVAPYGNPGNDWLEMNLRRARSPEERPSTNTSIGRVAVEDVDGVLAQKTDRSGFIESVAFDELRSFAQDSLNWMARRRLQVAEARRQRERENAPSRTSRSRESLQRQIEKAPKNVREDLDKALQRYDRERQRETDALRREVQLYRTLSTAGITAATFAHESSGNPLKVIGQSIGAIEFRVKKFATEVYKSQLREPIGSIRRALDTLGVLSSATLRLIDADKRRVGRVDLHNVIRETLNTFGPFFAGRDVDLRQDLAPGYPFILGTDAAVESIITNFINNSINSFEESDQPERILLVATSIIDGTWRLAVSDNGPGIEGISLDSIWLPGETRRVNGTGLGLTIVRDAVHDLGGTVSAEAHGSLSGATFVVELPILGIGDGD
jgi:C4-dicarboxylate-specific signal transduction histidine kinase